MFVTAKLQNIMCVPLVTGPAPADLVRLNSDNKDTTNQKCLPLHTVQHPIRDDLNLQVSKTSATSVQHLQHILESIGPNFFFFAVALRPKGGHGLLVLEVSRSHTTTQLVGLLWTSDQLAAKTST